MKILVTGATGKVGQTLIRRYLDERSSGTLRAFCHNRMLDLTDRLEVVRGSIDNRDDVNRALEGVTHVVHLATCKETPDDVIDVTVKGLFWLLEACRESASFQQFILIGGDAAIGHFVYPHPIPVTEQKPFSPYPGCYALSKVLEEAMLEQYYTQYDFNGCCLRAPWIMEKDDFKCSLSFGDDVFGRPRWCDVVGPERAKAYREAGTVPILIGADGKPLKRNFVHVEDLASAILAALDHPKARQQLFHVCMDEPVDYGQVAAYLKKTRGFEGVDIETQHHSTWLDNAKAKFLLDWRPDYDHARLVDESWNYERQPDDPQKNLVSRIGEDTMADLNHLTQEDLDRFDEEGYLVFEGLFDDDLNQRLKDDVDLMMEDRERGEKKMIMSYDQLGLLTSEPAVIDRVADLMDGKVFTHHHIHARWQGEGERGVVWHHDYVQTPQTNRSHLMVHVFMYLDGLNGEVGDLLVMPGTHKKIMNGDAFRQFEYEDLPGSKTYDNLVSGSIIIVHSAVQHCRRPKPGGQTFRRYFIDTSYCQNGVLWGGYNKIEEINKVAIEKGYDRDGRYAFLYDSSQFFERAPNIEKLGQLNEGSLVLQL